VQSEKEVFPIHSRITNKTAQSTRKPLASAYRSSHVLNLLVTATYTFTAENRSVTVHILIENQKGVHLVPQQSTASNSS
jgi:hypothetical protein